MGNFMKQVDRNMAITVIALFTILMQIHSIEYWQADAGDYAGVAWSLAIEAAMLFLWYKRRHISWFKDWLLPLKVGLALLLISGPWYQLATPAIEKLEEKAAIGQRVERAEAKVEQLRASLAKYEENSGKKFGWAGRIDETRAELKEAEKKLDDEWTAADGYSFDWRLYMKAIVQAFALLGILFTQLVAVSGLPVISGTITGNPKPESKPKPEPKPARNPTSQISEYDLSAIAVAKALNEKLPEYDNSQKDLAEIFAFSRKDVSIVLNHVKLRKEKKETISRKSLQDMMMTLGVKKGEY